MINLYNMQKMQGSGGSFDGSYFDDEQFIRGIFPLMNERSNSWQKAGGGFSAAGALLAPFTGGISAAVGGGLGAVFGGIGANKERDRIEEINANREAKSRNFRNMYEEIARQSY